MKTLHAGLAAAALAAGAVPLMASGKAEAGPEPEVCWLAYQPAGDEATLTAFAAPGLSGHWSLRVHHADGYSFDSTWSGSLDAPGADPVVLGRFVLKREMPTPAAMFAGFGRAEPGTTVIAGSGLVADRADRLALRAELDLVGPRGEPLCRTRDIAWLEP
ncbi:hypothetical protein E5163_10015 [Marinicauda algicola]|uniref:Uncharacterized protein n=1 Tax=Marinicauda algicola TaxID=2029849 RepID=A0A4S2GYC5_9PROT|nr:hypothetical protein [Marinicauda algicola]TGY88165.1 hypothetical protein E5163_10015 [Marinicauda algicola]